MIQGTRQVIRRKDGTTVARFVTHIPLGLAKDLKILAVERGVSTSALVTDMLTRALDEADAEASTR